MGRETRLIKNTIILFIGVVGTRLISFIMLPFLTSWLSVIEYGIIDIFNTIVSLCVPIMTLQLEQAVFRYMIDDHSIPERRITVTTGIISLSICLTFLDIIALIFLMKAGVSLYYLYLLAINLQCYYVMFQQILRGKGENHIYAQNSVLLAFSNCIATVIFIRFISFGVKGYIIAFCIAHVIAIVFMCIKSNILELFDLGSISQEKAYMLIKYSLPMILNNVSWWILNASDKLILNYFIGYEANGVYAAAGKIPGLVITVYTVFQMAWQESASREQGSETSSFYSIVFRKIFAIITYFVIVLLLMGRMIFAILISNKFNMAYYHLPVLSIALLFLCISQFYGGIYVGLKNSKELGWTSAVAAIFNLIIDLVLVNTIGIFAASISTLVAYVVLSAIRFIMIRRVCSISYRIKEVITTVIAIIIAFVESYLPFGAFQICSIIIVSLLFWNMYKDIFMEVRCIIIKKLGH